MEDQKSADRACFEDIMRIDPIRAMGELIDDIALDQARSLKDMTTALESMRGRETMKPPEVCDRCRGVTHEILAGCCETCIRKALDGMDWSEAR